MLLFHVILSEGLGGVSPQGAESFTQQAKPNQREGLRSHQKDTFLGGMGEALGAFPVSAMSLTLLPGCPCRNDEALPCAEATLNGPA